MKTVTGLLRWGLPLLLLSAAPLGAAVRFEFTAEAPTYSYSGRMWIDGDRSRTDITSGNHPLFNPNITLITRETGIDLIIIDHSRKTFFQRITPPLMRGPLATAGGIGRVEATSSRVTRTRETLEGPARIERHTVRAEYTLKMDVEGEQLDATVSLVAESDVDPSVPQRAFPWGLQYSARTGFPRVDNAIARRLPKRLPLRQVVTASRQIAGGPLLAETFTITVSNVVEEPMDPREFYAPAGYRYEEPVFVFGN